MCKNVKIINAVTSILHNNMILKILIFFYIYILLYKNSLHWTAKLMNNMILYFT